MGTSWTRSLNPHLIKQNKFRRRFLSNTIFSISDQPIRNQGLDFLKIKIEVGYCYHEQQKTKEIVSTSEGWDLSQVAYRNKSVSLENYVRYPGIHQHMFHNLGSLRCGLRIGSSNYDVKYEE